MLAFKRRTIAYCFCFLLSLTSTAIESRAQSLDVRTPTPVRRNEVVGRISARDLGDARLTDHFYTFAGTPGDLLITIETRNLNGDIDVFTAGALRPILKVAVYAESTSPVTKNIYLRQREELILRIEARSPNDDDGVYRIRFTGTFEAMAGPADDTEEIVSLPTARKGKRVSSVGARVEDPVPPPVDVPESTAPERTETATEDPAPMEVKKEPVVEAPVRTSRNSRTRPAPTSRKSTSKPAPAAEAETKVESAAETTETPPTGETTTKTEPTEKTSEATTTPSRRNSRRGSTSSTVPESTKSTPPRGRNSKRNTPIVTTETPSTTESPSSTSPESTTEADAQGASKIIVELLDGTRFERFMTAVRRVTVENGQIVVVGTDGKVNRIRLSTVVRMSIGP